MVIKRTIESLRERPHDERMAFAGLVAIAVMVLLSGAWGLVFLSTLRDLTAQESSVARKNPIDPFANRKDQAASAAASVEDIIQSTVTGDGGAYAPADTGMPTINTTDTYPDSANIYPSSEPISSSTQDSTDEVIRKLQESMRPY